MRSDRAGFSLFELLIGLVILGILVMGVQTARTDRLLREMARLDVAAVAQQLAADRLQTIQADLHYDSLPARYVGTEDSIADFPGFRRSTRANPADGYTTFTVVVITPDRQDTVSSSGVVQRRDGPAMAGLGRNLEVAESFEPAAGP